MYIHTYLQTYMHVYIHIPIFQHDMTRTRLSARQPRGDFCMSHEPWTTTYTTINNRQIDEKLSSLMRSPWNLIHKSPISLIASPEWLHTIKHWSNQCIDVQTLKTTPQLTNTNIHTYIHTYIHTHISNAWSTKSPKDRLTRGACNQHRTLGDTYDLSHQINRASMCHQGVFGKGLLFRSPLG